MILAGWLPPASTLLTCLICMQVYLFFQICTVIFHPDSIFQCNKIKKFTVHIYNNFTATDSHFKRLRSQLTTEFESNYSYLEYWAIIQILITKGQLISKANFLVLIWAKNGMKLFFDFCPKDLKWVKSKKWSHFIISISNTIRSLIFIWPILDP